MANVHILAKTLQEKQIVLDFVAIGGSRHEISHAISAASGEKTDFAINIIILFFFSFLQVDFLLNLRVKTTLLACLRVKRS